MWCASEVTRSRGSAPSTWRKSSSTSCPRQAGTLCWGDPALGGTEPPRMTVACSSGRRSNPNPTEPRCPGSQVGGTERHIQSAGWPSLSGGREEEKKEWLSFCLCQGWVPATSRRWTQAPRKVSANTRNFLSCKYSCHFWKSVLWVSRIIRNEWLLCLLLIHGLWHFVLHL